MSGSRLHQSNKGSQGEAWPPSPVAQRGHWGIAKLAATNSPSDVSVLCWMDMPGTPHRGSIQEPQGCSKHMCQAPVLQFPGKCTKLAQCCTTTTKSTLVQIRLTAPTPTNIEVWTFPWETEESNLPLVGTFSLIPLLLVTFLFIFSSYISYTPQVLCFHLPISRHSPLG